jgi:hypothetical protein
MVENKRFDIQQEGYEMHKETDWNITAEDLNTGRIEMRPTQARTFLKEHKRTSMAECKGLVQEPFIVYCNDIPIGLINLCISMMRNKARDSRFPDGKGVNDFYGRNIQTCVSYPWASKYLVGKLLASVSCGYGAEKGMDFIETTSLFGKSIQYDRLPFLRMHGYTTGSTGATYLFPHKFFLDLHAAIKSHCDGYLTDDSYFSKKKSLIVGLLKLTGLFEKGYRASNITIKRGYYLCVLNENFKEFNKNHLPPGSVEEAVEYWRKRWLVKRL